MQTNDLNAVRRHHRRIMLCMGETEWLDRAPLRLFEPTGDGTFACTECGWLQDTVASGAYELCMNATWHSLARYRRMAELARTRGFDPPDEPPYYRTEDAA